MIILFSPICFWSCSFLQYAFINNFFTTLINMLTILLLIFFNFIAVFINKFSYFLFFFSDFILTDNQLFFLLKSGTRRNRWSNNSRNPLKFINFLFLKQYFIKLIKISIFKLLLQKFISLLCFLRLLFNILMNASEINLLAPTSSDNCRCNGSYSGLKLKITGSVGRSQSTTRLH